MAVLKSTQKTELDAGRFDGPADATGGKVIAYRADITLASQTTSDTIELFDLPTGAKFLYGVIDASATLGSSTVGIGITGATTKYRAQATFTAATPTLFGPAAAADVAALKKNETPFITIGAANLPSSGTLRVTFFVSV